MNSMMVSRFILCVFVFFSIPAAHAAGVLERAVSRGGLIAAANPDALPLAERSESGSFKGFDIEVSQEIAKRLDMPVSFVTPGWDKILDGDWNGKWDYSVSNITPTEARSRRLAFPAVYRFEAVIAVVHRDNNTTNSPSDLTRKTVGVAQDTTFEQYLMQDLKIYAGDKPPPYQIENPKIQRYKAKIEALKALAEGDGTVLDAVVTSFATAQTAIDNGLPVKIVPGFLFWEPVAVAVEQGDEVFAERVNEVVEGMLEDGTLSTLSIKWFGLDMTSPGLQ